MDKSNDSSSTSGIEGANSDFILCKNSFANPNAIFSTTDPVICVDGTEFTRDTSDFGTEFKTKAFVPLVQFKN